MPTLYLIRDEEEPRPLQIDDELLVGRSNDCDLSIPDQRLSRRHAKFFVRDTKLYVEDLGSTTGTYVNERAVKSVVLDDGDVVKVGKALIRVGSPKRAASVVSRPPDFVKPIQDALPPDLDDQLAKEYFDALGIGDQTLLDGKADALESAVKRTRNFVILHEVTKRIQREHDAHRMLGAVVDLVLNVTGADRGYVVLLDESDEPKIELVRTRNRNTPVTDTGPQLSQTVLRYVIEERCGVICVDPTADARFQDAESLFLTDTRSLMSVPILVQNRVLGLIEIESSHLGTRFVENDLDLLSVTASTVGVALHNLRLAEKREQTIRDLEAAQDELLRTQGRLVRAEQMAVLGRLATGIAHEVKNHLSPFMLADMIAKKYPDDANIQDASEMMLEAQRHILDLVNEIRAFVSGSPTELSLQPEDLAKTVESVVRFMNCDKVVKRTEVVLQLEDRPVLNFDARGIRQVLVNLIKNAADAVDPTSGKIEIGVKEFDDHALLVVRDNGSGIPEEAQARIFEPFFTTKGQRGLGLGLDISKKIVEGHGGTMTMTSNPGMTMFRVKLPL